MIPQRDKLLLEWSAQRLPSETTAEKLSGIVKSRCICLHYNCVTTVVSIQGKFEGLNFNILNSFLGSN